MVVVSAAGDVPTRRHAGAALGLCAHAGLCTTICFAYAPARLEYHTNGCKCSVQDAITMKIKSPVLPVIITSSKLSFWMKWMNWQLFSIPILLVLFSWAKIFHRPSSCPTSEWQTALTICHACLLCRKGACLSLQHQLRRAAWGSPAFQRNQRWGPALHFMLVSYRRWAHAQTSFCGWKPARRGQPSFLVRLRD